MKDMVVVDVEVVDENQTKVNGGYITLEVNGVTIVDEHGNPIQYNVTGGHVTITTDVTKTIGENTIKATYTNAGEYNTVSNTTTFNVNKTPIQITQIPEITIKYAESTTITLNIKDIYNNPVEGESQVTINIDGKTITTTTINDGVATLTVDTQTIDHGRHTVDIIVDENDNYATANTTTTLTIQPINTHITIDVPTITYTKQPVNVTISVVDENQTPVTRGQVIITVNGVTLVDENQTPIKYNITDGHINVAVNITTAGQTTINVTYTDEEKYATANATLNFTVNKTPIQAPTIDEITIKTGQNMTINFTLVDIFNQTIDGNTKVTIKIGSKTQLDKVTITDGVATLTVDTQNLQAGVYKVEVIIGENNQYTMTQTNTTLNIQLRNATITINTQTSVYSKQPLDVNVTIVEDMKPVDGGYVIFKINGCTIKDANGKTIKYAVVNGCVNAQLNTTKKVGAGNITVIYSNDKLYNKTTTTENITVNKTPIIIPEIPEITIKRGENMTLNFTIYDIYNNTIDGNTKVTIKINGKTQLDKAKVNGGVVNLTVNTQDMTTGNYKVEVIIQNSQYTTTKTNTTLHITLKTANVTIDVVPTDVYTKDPVDINITVTGEDLKPVTGGCVILKINGNTLKDNDGNTIKYNLTDGCLNTTLDVIKPAGNINITAIQMIKSIKKQKQHKTLQ